MVGITPTLETDLGQGMWVMVLPIAALHEQDVNAQQMQPRHFDQLTANIAERQMIESLPYVYWPDRQGVPEIVSGHHRTRAARAAGLTEIPCLVDTAPMSRSRLVAKQIAHNELSGSPDQKVLAQLVAMVDNVDDMLTTGLDESWLPGADADDTQLRLPKGDFEFRTVVLAFLPHQVEEFKRALDVIDKHAELVGLAPREDFERFARTELDFGIGRNIRSVATSLTILCEIAEAEIADGGRAGWTRVAELFGGAMPPDAAKVVREAVERAVDRGDVNPEERWQWLEQNAAEYLAGR